MTPGRRRARDLATVTALGLRVSVVAARPVQARPDSSRVEL